MRVAAIGDNCIDVYPKLDRAYCTGNAVNFAVDMQRMGVPASMIGVTGNDDYGRWMLETLAGEGLDVSHFRRGDGPTAIAYMDMDGAECLHVRYEEGVLSTVQYTSDDIAFAASHDLVHSAPWGHVRNEDLVRIRRAGALISFDYSTRIADPAVERTLPCVDYAFFSLKQWDDAAERFLRDAVAQGPRVAVAMLGPRGSRAWDGNMFHSFGIFQSSLVNTVGAGDSFIAGFMRATLQGRTVAESLEAGARIAAQVVSVFGPWPEHAPAHLDEVGHR
jgi:fructoselysine 6-kinase